MATENIIGGINNQITDEFGSDNDLEVTGGGRGWTATTTLDGEEISAKGTSKIGAAEALYEEVKRLAALAASDELSDEGMTEGEFEACVAECATSERDFCECKCGGDNHGILAGRTAPVVLLGKKPCKCGCGELTNRVFFPGHDARYHALQELRKYAAANGIEDLDEAKAHKIKAQRAAARSRRAARKAEAEKAAAKAAKAAAKVAATEAKVTKSRKAAKTESPKGDDLPF